jgi:hypothetical protein
MVRLTLQRPAHAHLYRPPFYTSPILCSRPPLPGHSKISSNNLHVYPQVYGPRCFAILQAFPAPGFAEEYYNNTCVLANAGENVVTVPRVGNLQPADFARMIVLGNNSIFVPGGNAPGPQGFANYSDFVAAGYDVGTVLRGDMPDAQTIVGWGAELLFV